jgi:hypothetical protein
LNRRYIPFPQEVPGSSASEGGATTPYPPASWSVADWYVNPVTGLDSNAGTGMSPVKTIMGGIVAKWGTTQPVLQQTTTIHLLASQTLEQEVVLLQPFIAGAGNNFVILGTLTAVGGAFPAGAVTAKVRGSPGTLLQVAGMPVSATAGMLVYNATKDSWATIDSLSGGVATMTQPLSTAALLTITAEPNLLGAEVDTWAPGDSLQLYTQPVLNLKAILPVGGDADAAFDSPVVWLQNLYIPDVSGVVGNSTTVAKPYGPGLTLSNCRLDTFLELDGSDGTYGTYTLNTWLNGGLSFNMSLMIGGASNTAENEYSIFQNVSTFDGDAILHGAVLAKGAYSICGFAYCDAIVSPVHGGELLLEPASVSATACQLWGPGSTNLEGADSSIQLQVGIGLTWTACLTVSAINIEGTTTGTSYAAGVWTDGRALTSANLDLYDGLQNPRTGNRYSST